MADTSWITQLQNAVPTGQNARFYAQQAARVRALDAIDPTLSQIPGGLIGASSLNVDDKNFYGQLSAYTGSKAAQASRSQFEQYAPGIQRVLWSRMDEAQQQALGASGYQPPPDPEQHDSSGGLFGGIGGALGGLLEAPTQVIGGAISPLLEPLGELGQIPADMYRAIRTQPAWVQQLAGVAALAAGTAAVVASGGTALPLLAGASPLLAGSGGALVGGFAAAGVVNSLQGNQDFWGKAFQWGDAGETTWNQGTIDKARSIIGTNGNVLELAKTLAFEDPLDLIEKFGGVQGSRNLSRAQKDQLAEELSLKAGPYQTPQQAAAYESIQKLMDDPAFNQAVTVLRQGKISPGRDFASLLGLDEGDFGYGTLSGLADAAFTIVTDPTLVAGRALKISRAARYGLTAGLGEAGTWANRVDSIAARPQVQRAFDVFAEGMGSEDYKWLGRQLPGSKELYPAMLNWKAAEAPAAAWDKALVHDFFRSTEGVKAIASGGAASSRHGLLEMPHLNPVQAKLSNVRAQIGGAIDFLDDKNISFKLTAPNEAATREYSTYQHLNTGTKIAVRFVDGIPILKDVVEGAATLGKSLVTLVPKNGFITLGKDSLDYEQVKSFEALSEIWRAVGIPSDLRGEMFNKLVGAGSAGQRRNVLDHFYRQMFDEAGLHSTTQGKVMGDKFIDHVHQALIGGTDKAVFENNAAQLIAIPDIREMRLATARQSILNHALNAADAQWITSSMSKVWKPAVLLRIGFIPRILGDELLSFVARMGVKGYLAGQMGLVAGRADDQLLAHARGIEHVGRFLNQGVNIASFGKLAKGETDELLHNWLLHYSQGIRSYARNGILSDAMKETPIGRYLTNPQTFHGLLLGGVGEDGRYAMHFIRDPRTQKAIASQVSSHHASVYGDPNVPDAERYIGMVHPDGKIEQAMYINPTNTRLRVDGLTGEGMGWQQRNQWDMSTNQSVRNIFDSWAVHNPSPTVTNVLDATPDFLPRLNQVTRNLDESERAAIAIVAEDNAKMIPALQQAASHYAERGDLRLQAAVKRIKNRDDAVREISKLSRRARTVMDEIRPMLDHDGNFKGWLGHAVWEPTDVTVTKYSSEAAHRAALKEANRDWFNSPEFKGREWTSLDQSVKSADGIPVAYPQDEKIPHLYMPYGDNVNGVLDQLGEASELTPEFVRSAFQQAGQTIIDNETAEAIARMVANRKVALGRGWNQDGPYAVSMLTNDAQLTKKVSDAFARVAREPSGSIVEVPSHRSILGGLRTNHGVPWASDPVSFTSGGTKGYFLDLDGMDRNFIVHGPDVPVRDGQVGLTTPEAIEAFMDQHANGIYDLYYAPRTGVPDPGDVTIHGNGPTRMAEGPRHLYHIDFGKFEDDGIKNASSAPVHIEGNKIHVDPTRANLDLASGSPYLHGKAQVQREAIEVPTKVGPVGTFEESLPWEETTTSLDAIPVKKVKDSTFQARAITDMDGKPIIEIDEKNISTRWAQYQQAYEEGRVPPEWWRTARSQHTDFHDFMGQFDNEAEYRDFVIAHERGHMANGHAWTERPEPNEAPNSDWIKREQDADQVAYQMQGKAPLKRDARSIRISRALDEAGVDKDQLIGYLSGQGQDFYGQFLADLEANRLRNGDTLAGDIVAVEAMAGKYQIPFSGQGAIRGIDNAAEPRLNWGVIGPKALENKLPFEVRLADPTDVSRLIAEDRPRQAVQTLKQVAPPQSKIQKVINWGFDKVGTAQDVLLRNPMAMATYVNARRDLEPLFKELLDPQHFGDAGGIRQIAKEMLANDTRTHWSKLTKAEQRQLVRAGRILNLSDSPRVAEVARRVGGSEEAVQFLRGEGHDAFADLVERTTASRTIDDQIKDLMAKADQGDFSWVPEGKEALAQNAHRQWGMVQDQMHDHAIQRTLRDMTPFVDDHRYRSQFQQYANNVVPFWYAEDQFMRRWWRTFVYDPTVIRKAQLFHEGLKSTGFVQTDGQGNDIYIFPGSTAFAETVAKLPFLHDNVPITSAITGQLALTLPGLNRFGQPSASPLIGLPLQQISSILPEVRPIADAFTGGQSQKGILRSLVPGHIMRFVDAFTANDQDRAFSSAMKTAAQVLEANGHGLKDDADLGEQEKYLERLRNHARTILVTQALFGFLAPAPPNVIALEGKTPGSLASGASLLGIGESVASLRPEYLNYVRNLGVEEGTRLFLEKYPDTTPDELVDQGGGDINRNIAYSKGFSETEGRAPVPPTQQATDWYRTNQEWAKQYPYASAWMMPPAPDRETALDVDMNVYREQQAMGLRKDIAPTDYVQNLKFAAAAPLYFDRSEQLDTMLASAKTPEGRKQVQAMKQRFTIDYLSSHPWFAEQLQSGEAKARRGRVLDELRIALQDPASPQAWHTQGMREMLAAYDKYLVFSASLAGRSDTRSTKTRAKAKNSMLDWGTAYVMQHPELSSFWSGIIKPEVG